MSRGKLKILSFVGTRPEVIKSLAFQNAAQQFPQIDFSLFHVAQNFGQNMIDQTVDELGIQLLGRSRPIDRTSLESIARSYVGAIETGIREYSPDIVISNTDTDTAYYTAWVASKMKVPVAHIEGGIRCEARSNPEELNRKLADHLAEWVFTISDEDSKNIIQEGFPANKVFNLGDITWDVLKFVIEKRGLKPARGSYNLLTVHRQENAGNPERLKAIIDGVERAGVDTVFAAHPRTRESLEKAGLWERVSKSKVIRLEEPQSYFEMTQLLTGCNKVLSDSGGLRREAYMVGKPVISLVWFVWFHKMNSLGFEHMVEMTPAGIVKAIEEYEPKGERPSLFGDGAAGRHILACLEEQWRA